VIEWQLVLTTTERIADLLRRAREGGVVLDYAELEFGPAEAEPEDIHRQGAIAAVRAWSPQRGVPFVDIDPAVVPGRQIGVDEFYGRLFDREGMRLLVPAGAAVSRYWQDRRLAHSAPSGYGPYMWAGDEDPMQAVFFPYEGRLWGYADAFVDPPYHLQLPPVETQEIFLGLDDQLLGRPDESLEAFVWECPEWDPKSGQVWAPYFEYNWWGGSLWTLRTTPSRILAIGASASD
jgi:hypothetical protein